MRPLYVLLSLLLLHGPVASGQHGGRSGMGLKAAAQWCSLSAPGASYQATPGVSAGVYFPLWCGARFELQPELLISLQGTANVPADESSATLRTTYAQLPISAKFYFSNCVNAQVGVLGGQLLSAKLADTDVKELYNGFDFGFMGGFGVDLTSGFDITARYYMGRTTVLAGTPTIFPTNRVASLGFGYRIARFAHTRHRRRG